MFDAYLLLVSLPKTADWKGNAIGGGSTLNKFQMPKGQPPPPKRISANLNNTPTKAATNQVVHVPSKLPPPRAPMTTPPPAFATSPMATGKAGPSTPSYVYQNAGISPSVSKTAMKPPDDASANGGRLELKVQTNSDYKTPTITPKITLRSKRDETVYDSEDDDDYGDVEEGLYDWTMDTTKAAGNTKPPLVMQTASEVLEEHQDDESEIPDALEVTPTKKHALVPELKLPQPIAKPATPPPQPVKIQGTPPSKKAKEMEQKDGATLGTPVHWPSPIKTSDLERSSGRDNDKFVDGSMARGPKAPGFSAPSPSAPSGVKRLGPPPARPPAPRPTAPLPATPLPPGMAATHEVKETTDINRVKVAVPTQLVHKAPTTGNWLKKRYIVNNYILLDTLGTGSYGEVRLSKDRTTDLLYAVKIMAKDMLMKKKGGQSDENYFEDIKREIAIMKKLKHPNVLRLYEVLDDPKVNKMYLVVEYMKKGDLINVIKSKYPEGDTSKGGGDNFAANILSDHEIWNIFRQLAAGVRYLHYQNVIHGDIKPQNLLVGEDGTVKIADFGISKMVQGSSNKLADAVGTPAFMAPELCAGDNSEFSGQLADVWAMGATIFMLKYGHPPFVAGNIISLYNKIMHDPLTFPGGIPVDPLMKRLLEGMLTKNVEDRYRLSDVIQHEWMRKRPPMTEAVPMFEQKEDTYNQEPRGPGVTVTEKDMFMSIAMGTRTKEQLKKDAVDKLKSTGGGDEDIMATGWGDDVFEQVSDDGIDSDSDNSDSDNDVGARIQTKTETSRPKLTKRPFGSSKDTEPVIEYNTDAPKVIGDDMTEDEMAVRLNRFKSFSRDKQPQPGSSPATPSNLRKGSISLGIGDDDDYEEVDMEGFEKMMDTLAMQSNSRKGGSAKHASIEEVDEEDALEEIVATEETIFQNKTNRVATAFHSERGQRMTQEDRCLIAANAMKLKAVEMYAEKRKELFENLSNFTIACVFDGHNGSKCAQYVCQKLPPRLLLHDLFLAKASELELAFQDTFHAIDQEACAVLRDSNDSSGSTALVAVYDGRKKVLTVASVGDSMCVLSRGGKAIQMHKLHRLDIPEERQRVISRGGTVINDRVNSVLAISRAFGDAAFKFRDEASSYGTGPLSATPDIAGEIITPMTEFAVIATDGLFDILSPQQVVNFVRKRIAKRVDLNEIAKELVLEAIKEGSVDNVTALILSFHVKFK